MLTRVFDDLRHATRPLTARPAFSAFVVLILALGIGANSAIFGVVNATLFKRLAFPEIDRLMLVEERNLSMGFDGSNVSFPNFQDFVERSGVFEKASVATPTTRNLTGPEGPERLQAMAISSEFFEVFGLPMRLGRSLRQADQDRLAPAVVLLAERYWRDRYGSSPSLVGDTLRIDGKQHLVIGIAPHHKLYGDTDVWIPLPKNDVVMARTNHFLTMHGRLKPGGSPELAEQRLNDVAKVLEGQYPDSNEGWGATVSPLRSAYARDGAALFSILGAAVALVLLLVCANVAGLLVARASEREREIAVRLALGAGPGRVVRLLLLESLIVALIAGALGVAVGIVGARALAGRIAPELSEASVAVGLSPLVVMSTLGLSLLAGIGFGVGPALLGARSGFGRGLASGGVASAGRRPARARAALVAGQVAVSLPLLVLALSFLLIFEQSRKAELGFEPQGLLALQLDLPAAKYPDTAARAAVMDRLREEVASIPGVVAVGYSSNLPFSGSSTARGVVKGSEPAPPRDETRYASFAAVSAGYVRAVGLNMVDGRPFDDHEIRADRPLVLINETLARQLFGRTTVAGENVRIHTDETEPREIAGVFADVRTTDLNEEVRPEMLVPTQQYNRRQQWLAVRSEQVPEQVIEAVRARVAAVDPDQPVYGARTMVQLLAEELEVPRVLSLVIGSFGVIALGLALLGLYGLIAITVRQRRREVAIRITLGATTREVVRTTMGRGIWVTAIGLLIGLGACLTAQLTLGHRAPEFAQVSEFAPVTALLAAGLLGVSALIACYRPALRAAQTEPTEALRGDSH